MFLMATNPLVYWACVGTLLAFLGRMLYKYLVREDEK